MRCSKPFTVKFQNLWPNKASHQNPCTSLHLTDRSHYQTTKGTSDKRPAKGAPQMEEVIPSKAILHKKYRFCKAMEEKKEERSCFGGQIPPWVSFVAPSFCREKSTKSGIFFLKILATWIVCAFWGWISMDFLWGNIPSSWSTSETHPKDEVFGIEMRNTCVLALH